MKIGENGLRNPDRKVFWGILVFLFIALTIIVGIFFYVKEREKGEGMKEMAGEESESSTVIPAKAYDESGEEIEEEENNLELSFDISDFYITNIGSSANLYHVDNDHILWGCGNNFYGQLGQGTCDYEEHVEWLKIAENVVHVDYSGSNFVVYLTEDGKLYGFGNAEQGALLQPDDMNERQCCESGEYIVKSPVLLMEDVIYARCGRDDVAAMKQDFSVWIWGTVWYQRSSGSWTPGSKVCYYEEPVKVLEDVVLVTGGPFNHAALQRDGSVWTWGYNYSGNCGVKDMPLVSEPTRVAQGVVMVWTGDLQFNDENTSLIGYEHKRKMDNTIIQLQDGSYWICGINVGEEKTLPVYYEVTDWTVVCTHEFVSFDGEGEHGMVK